MASAPTTTVPVHGRAPHQTKHTSITTGNKAAQPRARNRRGRAFRTLSIQPMVARTHGRHHGPDSTHRGEANIYRWRRARARPASPAPRPGTRSVLARGDAPLSPRSPGGLLHAAPVEP